MPLVGPWFSAEQAVAGISWEINCRVLTRRLRDHATDLRLGDHAADLDVMLIRWEEIIHSRRFE